MSDATSLVHAGYDEDDDGLGDFNASDMTVPRIKIIHNEGVYQDTLSNEKFETLDVILFGLVKQRILWDPEVSDDAIPLCKSFNFKAGLPPEADAFPWDAAGFDQADAEANADDTYGLVLPCDGCGLKEWGTDPKNGKAPWCTEQHTYPLAYNAGTAEDPVWAPAILTVQKTGIKPSKAYCTSFKTRRKPLFEVVTTLGLTSEKRGSVTYSTPIFSKGEPTDPAMYDAYKENYISMRDFLTTPPVRDDEDDATPVAKPTRKTTAKAAPAKARPAPSAPATDDVDDDEEPPF